MAVLRFALLGLLLWPATAGWGQSAADPRRRIQVERYGVTVRAPQAWELTHWGEADTAFVLRLPQEDDDPDLGHVRCELSLTPVALQKLHAAEEAAQLAQQALAFPTQRLLTNRLETRPVPVAEGGRPADEAPEKRDEPAAPADNQPAPAPAEEGLEKTPPEQAGAPPTPPPAPQQLVVEWEHRRPDASLWFEQRVTLVENEVQYTFVMTTDEAHYEAYRRDFADLLRSAQFVPLQSGLRRLESGAWYHEQAGFVLRLPAGWRPTIPASRRQWFVARSESGQAQLAINAGPDDAPTAREQKERWPAAIRQADPQANVVSCELIPLRQRTAVEAVYETRRGAAANTILERRFRTRQRNYEIRCVCPTERFEGLQKELRGSLDSFEELPPAAVLPVF